MATRIVDLPGRRGLVSLLEILDFYADKFVNLQRELTWLTTTLWSYEKTDWLSRLWGRRSQRKLWPRTQ